MRLRLSIASRSESIANCGLGGSEITGIAEIVRVICREFGRSDAAGNAMLRNGTFRKTVLQYRCAAHDVH